MIYFPVLNQINAKMLTDKLTGFFGLILVFLNVLQSALTQAMAHRKQHFSFRLSSLVFSTECMKLGIAVVSMIVFAYSDKNRDNAKKLTPTRRTILVMAIPALLYTISNTLTYQSIALMGSTNFQIWGNMRIVFTAVLSRLFALRPMIVLQWLAIVLLLLGSIAPSSGVCDDTHTAYRMSMTSILCVLAQTLCTSLAGIYQEVYFKSSDQHFTLKNTCLYMWTCVFSALKMQEDLQESDDGVFAGFSNATWLTMVVYACYGQAVSLTLAYADNLVKVFATSFGATVSLLVDVFAFGLPLQLAQILGSIIVIISTILFYTDTCVLTKNM